MRLKKTFVIIIAVVALAAVLGAWRLSQAGASEPKGPARGAREVPVTTAPVVVKAEPLEIRAIGQTEAVSTVDVHPQVGGQLTRIAFKEGDFVKKGTVLFGIDPRTPQTDVAAAEANYERAVAAERQARATLAKDQAIAKNAAAEAERYAMLVERGVVSRSNYDQYQTNAEAAAATVRADQDAVATQAKSVAAAKAAVDAAKVQLGFTTIVAPVDGKTGALMAHLGDVVAPNDQSPLVVIAQIAPINVTFSIPEPDFVRLQQARATNAIGVSASLAADPSTVATGTLSFVDNAVDPATGTIKLKATFPNADQRFWPGQFVNVSVTLGVEQAAVVAPKVAVQTGQQGQYVFVVKADSTVEMRQVAVARTVGDDAVISSGLAEGEKVVTDGQLRLVPGAKITESQAVGSEATKS